MLRVPFDMKEREYKNSCVKLHWEKCALRLNNAQVVVESFELYVKRIL